MAIPITANSIAMKTACSFVSILIPLLTGVPQLPTQAQPILSPPQSLSLQVNSLQDGAIQADTELILREAIGLANGTLTIDQLSPIEQNQVRKLPQDSPSLITFVLPDLSSQPVLNLTQELPPLASANLIFDGAIGNQKLILTIAPNTVISRGLILMADGITVRNTHLYGFKTANNDLNSQGSNKRANTLTGNIIVTHGRNLYDLNELPWMAQVTPPQGVKIENNILGRSEQWATLPRDTATASSFGIVIFEGIKTHIENNQFYGLQGSAILTGAEASETQIIGNTLQGNGGAGMPDAIHLEGTIAGTEIHHNTICHSAGSAVFLFKPKGAITIRDNDFHYNGEVIDRAAIYLMGSGHQVFNNHITHQSGGGIVVAAYPRSTQNRIQANRFSDLAGLSIDLVARRSTGVWDYALGDGVNPPRDSGNRRLDTANQAIDAPQFLGEDLFLFEDQVTIAGHANPGSIVDIYQVAPNPVPPAIGIDFRNYAPLQELLGSVRVDEATGQFQVSLKGLQPGDRISAIATDPRFGTSEPAKNAIVRTIDAAVPIAPINPIDLALPCQESVDRIN